MVEDWRKEPNSVFKDQFYYTGDPKVEGIFKVKKGCPSEKNCYVGAELTIRLGVDSFNCTVLEVTDEGDQYNVYIKGRKIKDEHKSH